MLDRRKSNINMLIPAFGAQIFAFCSFYMNAIE